MDKQNAPVIELSSAEKKRLRGLGHHLEPVVYVGKGGMSSALLQSLEAALKAHELIKIKIGENSPMDRHSAGNSLAELTGAALVQVIGRMVLLYRPNLEETNPRRIAPKPGRSTSPGQKVRQRNKKDRRTRPGVKGSHRR